MKVILSAMIALALAMSSPTACAHAMNGVAKAEARVGESHGGHAEVRHGQAHHGHAPCAETAPSARDMHDRHHHDGHDHGQGHDCQDDCEGGADCPGCAYSPTALALDAPALAINAMRCAPCAVDIAARGVKAATPAPPPKR